MKTTPTTRLRDDLLRASGVTPHCRKGNFSTMSFGAVLCGTTPTRTAIRDVLHCLNTPIPPENCSLVVVLCSGEAWCGSPVSRRLRHTRLPDQRLVKTASVNLSTRARHRPSVSSLSLSLPCKLLFKEICNHAGLVVQRNLQLPCSLLNKTVEADSRSDSVISLSM